MNKNLDEALEIKPHDPLWSDFYLQEADQIKKIFKNGRLLCMQHHGSTSVTGLHAKPIVDILVGLSEFYLSDEEKEGFKKLGYQYFGKHIFTQRIFLRKRGDKKFNLAVVKYNGEIWNNNLAIRDCLRSCPKEVLNYANLKHQAIKEGVATHLEYSYFKQDYMIELLARAKHWKKS